MSVCVVLAGLGVLQACVIYSGDNPFDMDEDGIVQTYDCNDYDAAVGSQLYDLDGDGYGGAVASSGCCDASEPDCVAKGGDCDDGVPEINPDVVEACDGLDNDCNDLVDEGIWYFDRDGDTFGDIDSETERCVVGKNYVLESTDCCDTDAEIYPGAVELCTDGVDNNCDEVVNERCIYWKR